MFMPVFLFVAGLIVAVVCFCLLAFYAFNFRWGWQMFAAFCGFAIGGVLSAVGFYWGAFEVIKTAFHM